MNNKHLGNIEFIFDDDGYYFESSDSTGFVIRIFGEYEDWIDLKNNTSLEKIINFSREFNLMQNVSVIEDLHKIYQEDWGGLKNVKDFGESIIKESVYIDSPERYFIYYSAPHFFNGHYIALEFSGDHKLLSFGLDG